MSDVDELRDLLRETALPARTGIEGDLAEQVRFATMPACPPGFPR